MQVEIFQHFWTDFHVIHDLPSLYSVLAFLLHPDKPDSGWLKAENYYIYSSSVNSQDSQFHHLKQHCVLSGVITHSWRVN